MNGSCEVTILTINVTFLRNGSILRQPFYEAAYSR